MSKKITLICTCVACTLFAGLYVYNVASLFKSEDKAVIEQNNATVDEYEKLPEPNLNVEVKGYKEGDVVEPIIVAKHNYRLSIDGLDVVAELTDVEGDHTKVIGEQVYSQLYDFMKGDLSLKVKPDSVVADGDAIWFILADKDTGVETLKTYYNAESEIIGQCDIL